MSQKSVSPREHSIAYNIFILALTVLSLAVMFTMLLPLSDATLNLLSYYDNLICIIFLIDFFLSLKKAPNKSVYFFRQGGWLDLLGSIPTFGITKYGGLLRLARLSRFIRILRLLRGEDKKSLLKDIVDHRSHYVGFVTILLALLVLTISSVLVLQFESRSPDAKIVTGWDAFWYAIVTITTVGYGDFYPVTFLGRITAMFIMFSGVGIIGVLASLLSNMLMGSPIASDEGGISSSEKTPSLESEISAIRSELTALRQFVEELDSEKKGKK
jgi:voltage-gated potassium channel